ncbi:hypothetical protein PHLCEN_2v11211 [Hermanssonia centrifuga]|uniref:Uncharacterized protein n=1 Tax=Hermanssonia centrifuga TaxID=98765 RepID=A0A2R6NKZ1_9APHY|nr:hypothetical protein PHLCEN_2v11211 [Hermanssonia centrifuga]
MIKKHQEEGKLEDPEYKAAVQVFYQKHVCRIPWPEHTLKSFAGLKEDATVYKVIAVQDICVSPLFDNIPKVKWVQMGESSHLSFFEEPERYFKVVSQFLTAEYSSTM